MSHREEALVLTCEGDWMPAILSRPANPRDTGVVIVVGGPQYRAGSHRQFVSTARRLADAGWPVLRFDVRGMGDATGETRSFETLDDDIAAAVTALEEAVPELQRTVLLGLCDGASAALMYCGGRDDPRIAGLCLLNPWLRSPTIQSRTQVKHYYLQRLLQRSFWQKLISGGVAWRALAELLSHVQQAAVGDKVTIGDYKQRMAGGWMSFAGAMLLVMSGKDFTAREFDLGVRSDLAWRASLTRSGLRRIDFAHADHTFSDDGDRLALEDSLLDWLPTVQAQWRQMSRR